MSQYGLQFSHFPPFLPPRCMWSGIGMCMYSAHWFPHTITQIPKPINQPQSSSALVQSSINRQTGCDYRKLPFWGGPTVSEKMFYMDIHKHIAVNATRTSAPLNHPLLLQTNTLPHSIPVSISGHQIPTLFCRFSPQIPSVLHEWLCNTVRGPHPPHVVTESLCLEYCP